MTSSRWIFAVGSVGGYSIIERICGSERISVSSFVKTHLGSYETGIILKFFLLLLNMQLLKTDIEELDSAMARADFTAKGH